MYDKILPTQVFFSFHIYNLYVVVSLATIGHWIDCSRNGGVVLKSGLYCV